MSARAPWSFLSASEGEMLYGVSGTPDPLIASAKFAVTQQPQSLDFQQILEATQKPLQFQADLNKDKASGSRMLGHETFKGDDEICTSETGHDFSESGTEKQEFFGKWIQHSASLLGSRLRSIWRMRFEKGGVLNSTSDAVSSASFAAAFGLQENFQSRRGFNEVCSIAPTPPPIYPPKLTQTCLSSRVDVIQSTIQFEQTNSNARAGTELGQPSEHPIQSVLNKISASPIKDPNMLPAEHNIIEGKEGPVSSGAQETAGNENLFRPAFCKVPDFGEKQNTETDSLSSFSSSIHHAQELEKTPVRPNAELPQSSGTSGPPSQTSSMEFIHSAALRSRSQRSLFDRTPLPRTAQELLLGNDSTTSDAESEEDSTGVALDGDVLVHPIAGDVCLMGPKRMQSREIGTLEVVDWGEMLISLLLETGEQVMDGKGRSQISISKCQTFLGRVECSRFM